MKVIKPLFRYSCKCLLPLATHLSYVRDHAQADDLAPELSSIWWAAKENAIFDNTFPPDFLSNELLFVHSFQHNKTGSTVTPLL